jgi:peptide/nickel transport system substrate-binding protein
MLSRSIIFLSLSLFSCGFFAIAGGVALHGSPKLGDNETPVYVNADAPKGGRLVTGVLGGYDTVNPFNLKGTAGPEIRHFTVESLMKRHMDEPFSLYPSLATSMFMNKERSEVTFILNDKARFSEGSPVTIDDIKASYMTLREKGRPNYRTYYSKVQEVITTSSQITFRIDKNEDRELPMILALMPIFKAGQFEGESFSETTSKPIIASGAYVITDVKFGEQLILKRNKNWWAKDLPINRGQQNFDELRFDFYRDQTAMLEAFKKGLIDWRLETDPQRWQDLKQGPQVYHEIKTAMPYPYRAYHFNMRREALAKLEVREALHLLFDGDFINQNLYNNAYIRTLSPFYGSELASEMPLRNAVSRETLRQALALLAKAGYSLKNGALTDTNGVNLTLEILVNTRDKERLAKIVAAQLLRAGVTLNIRLLDNVQYEFRLKAFDFDIIDTTLTNSLSPGNEQAFYWGAKAASSEGSRNYSGLKSVAVDGLIAQLNLAKTREEIVETAKKLDALLVNSKATLPLFQPSHQYIALQKHIKMPLAQSRYGYLPEVWWRE